MNYALKMMLGLMLEFCISNVFGMETSRNTDQRKGSFSSILEKDRPVVEVSGTQEIKLAVMTGDKSSFEELIKSGIDVNKVINNLGETPLYGASALGYEEFVKILLGVKGISLNYPNVFGWTPLHVAAFKGKNAVVKQLLDAKAILVDIKEGEQQSTPLIFAAYNRHREIVKMLLEAGADSNAADYCDKTALYWAVFNNDIDMARMLIWSGADVNKTEVSGKTPLHIAVFRANPEIVRLLVYFGADVNIADRNGDEPLKMALGYCNKECAEILVANYFKNKIKIPEDLMPEFKKIGIDISLLSMFAS